MGQSKAYQPLTQAMDDSKKRLIELEKGFDKILSDVVIKKTEEKCNDVLDAGVGLVMNARNGTPARAVSKIKLAASRLNSQINSLGATSGDADLGTFSKFICGTANNTVKLVFEILEVHASLPIMMVEDLTTLINKTASALNDITVVVMDCILDQIYSVQNYLTSLVPSNGNINDLGNLIDECPQLYCFLVDTFKPICKRVEFTSTTELLEALKDNITVPLGTLFDDFIVGKIKKAVDVFLGMVETARAYLVKKARGIIKRYIKALHKKRPIPESIAWIVSKSDCNSVKAASILDIVYGLEDLSSCLDDRCSSLSSTMKRDIQEFNKRLRLSFSHWKNLGMGYDLFIMLEREDRRNAAGLEARKSSVGTSDNPLKSVIESAEDDMDTPVNTSTDVDSLIANTYTEERQSLEAAGIILENGIRPFKKDVESDLVKMYQNLAEEIFIYEDKYNEFSKWDAEYLKSDLNDEKKSISELLLTVTPPDELSGQLQFLSSNSRRFVKYVRASHGQFLEKKNDYKPLSKDPAPEKTPGQSSLNFYSNWYGNLRS